MLVSTIERSTAGGDGGDSGKFGSTVLGCDEDGDGGDLKRGSDNEGKTIVGVGFECRRGGFWSFRDRRERRELRLRCRFFLTSGGSRSAVGGITLVGGSTT